jgi:hypothetical protein
LLVRLVRTMLRVTTNPNRPIGWKIFDALFLGGFVLLIVLCLFNSGVDWLFLCFFLWPVVYVVTQRSWWDMPRMARPSRRPATQGDRLTPGLGNSEQRSWDPLDSPAKSAP